MEILTYNQREEMKTHAEDGDRFVDYAHWQRFLESICNCMGINDDQFPSFKTYRQWKKDYPGWSHHRMDNHHAAWRKEYEGKEHPMNFYYDRWDKLKKTKKYRIG